MKTLRESLTIPIELADHREDALFHARNSFCVALLIPLCGSAGIWAPSCISSAQVAVAELNQSGRILGRTVKLSMTDAAVETTEPNEDIINDLID